LLIGKFYKEEVFKKFGREGNFRTNCKNLIPYLTQDQKEELKKIFFGIKYDRQKKRKILETEKAYECNILDKLYNGTKKFDLEKAKQLAINIIMLTNIILY